MPGAYGRRSLLAFLLATLAIGGAARTASAQTRRDGEVPPPLTAKECARLPEAKRRKTEECKTDEEKREDAYQKHLDEIADKEKPKHSQFWQWLHLDGMWVPPSTDAHSLGLVGMHMTVADIKGANFFGPPGVMLVMDERSGHRQWRPALTWGVSLHIADFHTGGRAAQLYLNLTKCWTTGDYQTGMDLAGLSVTWKQN